MEELTEEQQKRVEDNRQRALAKRKAAQTAKLITGTVRVENKAAGSRAGEGFFEPDTPAPAKKLYRPPDSEVECVECNKLFLESLGRQKFNFDVCDECRKGNDKYRLVPRTEAKTLFKLKDCDLDMRPPPLGFLEKPNPHREHGAAMRLYLFCQLEDRAKEVWGSLSALEEERNKRKNDARKRRKAGFTKKITELRRELRAQAYRVPANHEHTYGDEEKSPDNEDEYFKECTSCKYRLVFEKL